MEAPPGSMGKVAPVVLSVPSRGISTGNRKHLGEGLQSWVAKDGSRTILGSYTRSGRMSGERVPNASSSGLTMSES
jgi:hypothetical protein